MALSKQSPTEPIDGTTSHRRQRSPKAREVDWQPWTEWWIRSGATGLQCRHRGDEVDAMREQPNGGPNPDEAFRSTRDIRGGVTCFTGTRVGVSQLLGYLRDGYTIDDFLRDFPTVTKDQAQRAIERIDNEYVRVIERDGTREHQQTRDTDTEDGGFTA